MITLLDFLRARIAERERGALAAIRAAHDEGGWSLYYIDDEYARMLSFGLRRHAREPYDDAITEHVNAWSPVRVLAECDAKRRIIAEWVETHSDEYDDCDEAAGPRDMYELHDGHAMALSLVLRALATIDADHPDYRKEWRP